MAKKPKNYKWKPSTVDGTECFTELSYGFQSFTAFKSERGRQTWARRLSAVLGSAVDLSDADFKIVGIQVNIFFNHEGRKYRLYYVGESVHHEDYILSKYL